jgi:pimeloyl-ACP methyl ester carboxylesterase
VASFVLVHGAWHGGWCWKHVEPELRALGHDVTAVDLPIDDPESTFTTYAGVVAQSMDGLPDDVVLVGHSMAGLTIPLVPTLRPVQHLVFLCALIAEPGRSLVDQLQGEPEMLIGDVNVGAEVDEDGRHRWVDAQPARDLLYADCSDDDTQWAFEQLRPQEMATYGAVCPLDALPDTERTYVVCGDDRLVNPAWSRVAAPARLGVEAVELAGSHSPFLSRPAVLARLLDDVAGGADT